MKKAIYVILIFVVLIGIYVFRDNIVKLYYQAVIFFSPIDSTLEKNEFYRDYDFNYVKNTDDFEPNNEEEIINIFYTVINSGQETFSFYCPDEYTTCTDDVKSLANDQSLLSHINNFVHPYNGFKHIETQYNSLGEVTITVFKNYDRSMINVLNTKVDEIIEANIPSSYSDIEKIKAAHDYIINNSRYDTERSNNNVMQYQSDIAYGPLVQGYAICGGYSDAMQLFLEKFGIKSYKVASETHVWNVVYLNGYWYHLDLTWDDPVTPNGVQTLDDTYFLISTQQLRSHGTAEHVYDRKIYSELW